jgi:ribonuclease-3
MKSRGFGSGIRLDTLEARLGYSFDDRSLLESALTHSSFSNEQGAAPEPFADYEALEFLGDSLVGFFISEYLVSSFPRKSEGELSKIRSLLVSTTHLSSLSAQLDLGAFLRLGHGEEKTGGRTKPRLLADLFESIVAAIYLDGGTEPACRFVLERFQTLLRSLDAGELDFQDSKSLLQEHLHSKGLDGPSYHIVSEKGPDHEKSFLVEVVSQGKTLASGSGRSKKEAQQKAAEAALEHLGGASN